jgi:hypothetical protein
LSRQKLGLQWRKFIVAMHNCTIVVDHGRLRF